MTGSPSTCSRCDHPLTLHFDPEADGPGPCQEDIGTGSFENGTARIVGPCPCEGAPEDAR